MAVPLSYQVTITVNLASAGITRAGFGVPLVLSNTGNAWSTPELTRTYTTGSFAGDFPAGTVENLILTQLFAQGTGLQTVKVGKGTNKPTLTKTLTVSSAVSGQAYQINVTSGGTAWQAIYTAGGGDTTSTIATALAAVLGGTAWVASTAYSLGNHVKNGGNVYVCTAAGTSAASGGPMGTGANIHDGSGTLYWAYVGASNFSASATGAVVTCAGSAAGNWFALEPIASGDAAAVSNLMVLLDTTTDPGVATDLATIAGADNAWYGLIIPFKSSAIVGNSNGSGVSGWSVANGKLFGCSMSDTACATAAYSTGATDSLAQLTQLGNSLTFGQFHPRDAQFLEACTFGYFLPAQPGTDNWCNKSLSNVTPVDYTPTQLTNLLGRRAGFYSTEGGINILLGNGQVEDTTYAYIDTRRNVDYYATNLQADLVNLFIQNTKIANTNAGRALFRQAIANRNNISITQGIISGDPLAPAATPPTMTPYVVYVPDVSVAGSFNPATRALSGASTNWKLAGAIDSIGVTVNITQ